MAKRSGKKGFLLTLEGGEGAGKTTQIRALTAWLEEHRIPYEVTRQPGGSELGKGIRRLLLHAGAVVPRAELLLYEADRAQHVDGHLIPSLLKGRVILSDRFADSSTVYQGVCRKLGVPWTETLNRFATGGLEPDLTIVLDVPAGTGRTRLKKRKKLDRIEREKLAFHEKVRKGFLSLGRRMPKRVKIVDGRLPPEAVTSAILDHFRPRLRRKGYRV